MAGHGYSYVSNKGFSAFGHELEQGAWKDIAIATYDVADRRPASPLGEAPVLVTLKLRAAWMIRDLDDALGASREVRAELDGEWDAAERALNLYLASEAEHKDPLRRAAALRLRSSLLAGAGTEQTNYDYDAEVDFGLQQISRARKAPLADDVALLGLDSYLQRVEDATNSLAKGIGREPGQKRAGAPSKRLREATAACSATFNAIHETLSFLIEHTRTGKERDRIEALRAPFVSLLDRYPQRAKPEEEPAEAPADATA